MNESNDKLRRSWLLVSPLEENGINLALEARPDVLVVDLFERVSENRRDEAREKACSIVKRCSKTTEVFGLVHSNTLSQDLDSLVWPGLSGVILSRTESAQNVDFCSNLLSRLESSRKLGHGQIQIVASLETPLGNHKAFEIAKNGARDRLWGLTLGRADLEMDLRPEPSGELHLMPYLMQRLILVAAAAGITPLGAWWRYPARGLSANSEETYESAVRGRAIGFKGALILEALQVQSVNQAYV